MLEGGYQTLTPEFTTMNVSACWYSWLSKRTVPFARHPRGYHIFSVRSFRRHILVWSYIQLVGKEGRVAGNLATAAVSFSHHRSLSFSIGNVILLMATTLSTILAGVTLSRLWQGDPKCCWKLMSCVCRQCIMVTNERALGKKQVRLTYATASQPHLWNCWNLTAVRIGPWHNAAYCHEQRKLVALVPA